MRCCSCVSKLQDILRSLRNEVLGVNSCTALYFFIISESTKQRKELEEWEKRKVEVQNELRRARHEQKEEDTGEEFKLRDQILFGAGVLVLSILAAVHFGLINVNREYLPCTNPVYKF